MTAMTYIPEIDIALKAGNYSILVQRAESDLNASHITLALCDSVTALESDVETKDKELEEAYAEVATKDKELEEAYAEQARLEGIIDGKDDDVAELRDELEDALGEIESMSEVIAELRARLARHA